MKLLLHLLTSLHGTKRRIEPLRRGLLIEVKRTAMLRRGNAGF
jgi:hypothetical protein